jgi:hypothetical protein
LATADSWRPWRRQPQIACGWQSWCAGAKSSTRVEIGLPPPLDQPKVDQVQPANSKLHGCEPELCVDRVEPEEGGPDRKAGRRQDDEVKHAPDLVGQPRAGQAQRTDAKLKSAGESTEDLKKLL